MPDYRDPEFRDPNDPYRARQLDKLPPDYDNAMSTNARWGWIAAAVFIAAVVVVALLGMREDARVASTDVQPPITQTNPAPRVVPPATNPAPVPAPSPSVPPVQR
jgi:hypothetical protein